ncbi:Glutamyl-tRNA reductase [Streptomyces alboniger]
MVANRTLERAERLAEILGESGGAGVTARAVPMDAVADELTRADVAVFCTGATGLVLTADVVAAAVEGRVPAEARVGDVPAQARSGSTVTATRPVDTGDEPCPFDLSTARGFSVAGEAAVAGMDASSLEQHAAWVDNAPAERREVAAPDPRPRPRPSPRSWRPRTARAGCGAARPLPVGRCGPRGRARAARPRHAP